MSRPIDRINSTRRPRFAKHCSGTKIKRQWTLIVDINSTNLG